MGKHEQLIEGLNAQLNREISTFLRYMQQGAMIKGAQWETIRDMYLAEVNDEVGHAQYLANTIIELGGQPRLEPDLSPPPGTVDAMMRQDLENEWEDVRNYARLADIAGEHGLMAVKLQMEDQAADEENHARRIERLLG